MSSEKDRNIMKLKYKDVRNMRNFCRIHNLKISPHIYRVLSGNKPSYKGWTLLQEGV